MKNTQKQKKILCTLLYCILILSGCSVYVAQAENRPYSLYYVETNIHDPTGDIYGEAVRFFGIALEDMTPEYLLDQLLNQEEIGDLWSPFPIMLTIYNMELLDSGIFEVMFSPEYGELSGIQRTVADYSVVLTLTQLPRVAAVRISVFGEDKGEESPLLRSSDLEIRAMQDGMP